MTRDEAISLQRSQHELEQLLARRHAGIAARALRHPVLRTAPHAAGRPLESHDMSTAPFRSVSNNVVRWVEKNLEANDASAIHDEDREPELIPPRRQNVWLGAMVVITFLLIIGRLLGVLS